MDKFSSYTLFLAICIGIGVYLMRKNFTGFYRTVFGIPMPSYVIATAISIFIGLVLWVFLLIVVHTFKSPLM